MTTDTLSALSGMGFSEQVKANLERFAADPSTGAPTAEIELVIQQVALTGISCYEWPIVRPIVVYQTEQMINHFIPRVEEKLDVEVVKSRINSYTTVLNAFEHAPFTLQRLCEILKSGGSNFCSVTKLLNALEKLTRVTTVQPTLSPRSFEQTVKMATMMVTEGQKKMQDAAEQKKEVERQKKHVSDPMDID